MNDDPTKRTPDPWQPGAPEESQPDAFERALHQALHRREAVPADLTARLLAIAAEPEPALARPTSLKSFWQLFQLPQLPAWTAVAVAAVLVLIVSLAGGTAMHVRQQQHARAAEATRNFELATSIEDKALEHTREQLRDAGVSLEK